MCHKTFTAGTVVPPAPLNLEISPNTSDTPATTPEGDLSEDQIDEILLGHAPTFTPKVSQHQSAIAPAGADRPLSDPAATKEVGPASEWGEGITFEPGEFRKGMGLLAVIFVSLSIVGNVLALEGDILEINLLYQSQAGRGSDRLMGSELMVLFSAAGAVLSLVSNVGSVIVVSVWIYQAHMNLDAMGVYGRKITPGWAVGWFFVPVANLFKPLEAMRQLWKGSDPTPRQQSWKRNPSSALLGWWWAFWLFANLVSNLSFNAYALAMQTRKVEDYHQAAGVSIVASAFWILAGVLLIVIIWSIDSRQAKKYRLLREGEAGLS
jgi:hypothetical protein